MSKILGLDIGTNSIGWGIIDDEKDKIINSGVRIFQEGVNRDNKGLEISKNAKRREARQARRQFFRRKMRKQLLMKELLAMDMAPKENEARKSWLMLNPYDLRARALSEKLELHEIGRIFYHLAQRRGFLSNRKAQGDEEGKLFDGMPGDGKKGINELRDHLEDYQTIGEYFNEINHKEGEPYKTKERIRNRYTTRNMYKAEFDLIWEHQANFHPKIMTSDLRFRIGYKKGDKNEADRDGILFYQRPLQSQKYLIGR